MANDLFTKVSDTLYRQDQGGDSPLEWEKGFSFMRLDLADISVQENLTMLDSDGVPYDEEADRTHTGRTIGFTLARSLSATATLGRHTIIHVGGEDPSVFYMPTVEVRIQPVTGLGSDIYHVRDSFKGSLSCREGVDPDTGEHGRKLVLDLYAPDSILDEYCSRISSSSGSRGMVLELDIEMFGTTIEEDSRDEMTVHYLIEDESLAYMTRLILTGPPLAMAG